MRGGVHFYRGGARGARDYVEADRSRADDYYLAEGTGLAQRYSATAEGAVTRLADLDGDRYEAWVAGMDPDTGEPRGRLGASERSVRFAEVVVNGPKSWSLAAELHPEIAAAYEAAQDRAAEQIVAWMGQHATVRIGPRGGQISTPVERLEAVTVRHYTSRAGDPHRHLHVQINARVWAGEKWGGIDTVAVLNSIEAVHGIGHAAMRCDPAFRAALAAHGLSLDPDSGEVVEIEPYVGAFSKRAEQIGRQVDGYEAEWRAAHPDAEPGPALRRAWDARAWAEKRPGKTPAGGIETAAAARGRWVDELRALGYRDRVEPAAIVPTPVGQLDRDAAADEIVDRLTATRSAWNHPELRGQAEQLIARAGIVADPAARAELAEDLTARAAARSVRLPRLEGRHLPDHLRAWTSPRALAVEADITGRLAVRGAAAGADASPAELARAAHAVGARLDPAQADAAAALAGNHALVLVTGAAGAGKTTTLATAQTALEHDGHQVLIVAPTLKAARSAERETGADAASAQKLAHAHGWRWSAAGRWTRLQPGERDSFIDADTGEIIQTVYRGPAAGMRLRRGDLLVVDEAGMLDQDTAHALLHVVDEAGARLALIGDPHQLAAIGRGGVLDMAGRWADRSVMLDVIHRFTRTAEIAPGVLADLPDDDYAALSLRMRDGQDPAGVFDELLAAGHVKLHTTDEQLRNHVATQAVEARRGGRPITIAADTNDQVRAVNAAIRAQLADAGLVEDQHTTSTAAGESIGAGDVVATRRNDYDTGVANRDTWTVTAVHRDGSLTVLAAAAAGDEQPVQLAAGYVREHVELAYATTVHGVQGETAHAGHLLLAEHTGAGAAYVGMTRGRTANTVHIVTGEHASEQNAIDDAREQWIAAAGRDRTDLGVNAAGEAAAAAAEQYAGTAPRPDPDVQLRAVLAQLHAAWREQALAEAQLDQLEPQLAAAQAVYEREQRVEQRIAPLRAAAERTQQRAEQTAGPADAGRNLLAQRQRQIETQLIDHWNQDRPDAGKAARLVDAGPGRLGRVTGGKAAVADARRWLATWADKWRPVVDELRDADSAAAYAGQAPGRDDFPTQLRAYAQRRAVSELPQVARTVQQAENAAQAATDASATYQQALDEQRRQNALHGAMTFWRGPRTVDAEDLAGLAGAVTALREQQAQAASAVEQLGHSPAVLAHPDPAAWLSTARRAWAEAREQAQQAVATRAAAAADQAARERMARHQHDQPYQHGPERGGPGIGR